MALTLHERLDRMGNLLDYSKYMFEAVNGSKFVENWHHEVICEHLEKCITGDITRLIINIPPRYSKTRLAVVDFISWSMGLYPDSEFIHVTYSATLAENNSYDAKMLVEHEAYKELFPNVELRKDSNARNKWMTTQGGVIHAMGTEGTVTGKGAGKMREGFAGAVIIDDPIKVTEAQSDTVRPKINNWFSSVLESRLNKKSTPIILIMQRLHEDDLSGFLIDGGSGEEWTVLNIPAISDNGEPLWPYKHSIEDLRRLEAKSPYTFSGQYMQRPSPQGGGMFKEAWLNWYVSHNMPNFKTTFITADTAIKTKEQNDYSVIQHWGLTTDAQLYLLDMKRGKWESPELDKIFKSFYADCSRKYKVRTCYIEDKASGSQLIQGLKKYGGIPITAVPRSIDKITRAQDSAPWVSMGIIHLNKEIDQIDSLVSELTTFPVGRHDDMVDALMDAINIGMFKNQGEANVSYGGDVKKNKYTNYG